MSLDVVAAHSTFTAQAGSLKAPHPDFESLRLQVLSLRNWAVEWHTCLLLGVLSS